MKKQRILLWTLIATLGLGSSVGTSWAFDPLGQMKDVATSVREGATEGVIQQLTEAKNKAKAELQAKLEKEMRAALEKGVKTLDEEFEKKIKKLKG